MPLLGIENGEKDFKKRGGRKGKRRTYYTGSMLVVQIGVRVHPGVRAGILGKAREKKEERSGSNEVLALPSGSTLEHDYVIRSRSRDRSSSA